MSADLAVSHPDLTGHAESVAAIGDRLSASAGAGRSVRAAGDAYGKMCSFLPAMLNALQDVLTGGIASEAGTLADTAVRLRTTADGYAAADDRSGAAFDAIGGD